MKTPLVIDVWGKQSNEAKPNTKNMTTRQLMSQDKLVRGRPNQGGNTGSEEEERYKLLCDVNTFKRRAERMSRKLVGVFFICSDVTAMVLIVRKK